MCVTESGSAKQTGASTRLRVYHTRRLPVNQMRTGCGSGFCVCSLLSPQAECFESGPLSEWTAAGHRHRGAHGGPASMLSSIDQGPSQQPVCDELLPESLTRLTFQRHQR